MTSRREVRVEKRRSVRDGVQWACYGLPVAVFVGTGWAHRYTNVDGFIYLRVVRQIRVGNGPVFNAGQRVEAATSPLWVALLSFLDLVTPVRLEWIAVLTGLACGAVGLSFAIAGARRLWLVDGERPLFVPLGALVFVALLPTWIFATSGLETGLTFGWLGVCSWILAKWVHGTGPLSTPRAIALGLGWLVRPELVLFSAAFFVLVIALDSRSCPRRSLVRVAAAMLALPVLYQFFRMGYYGLLVPNTALAKEGGQSNWARGWEYLWDFARPYWVWFAVLAMIAGGFLPLVANLMHRHAHRAVAVVVALILPALLVVVYVVAVGGDYQQGRLLLPSLFALCAPVAVVPMMRKTIVGLVVVPWAITAAFVFRPPQLTTANFAANGVILPQDVGVTLDDMEWGEGQKWRAWYTGPAYYTEVRGRFAIRRVGIPLARGVHVPVGAFMGIGPLSYAMGPDFEVIDLLGLADTLAAHIEYLSPPRGVGRAAGHEKPIPAPWLAAVLTPRGSRPDAADFPQWPTPVIPATTGRAFELQVAWARAALQCPGIARVLSAAEAPLTPRRFASNFFHSFTNTTTRIPPDPKKAYRQYCGHGTPPEVAALQRAGASHG